MLTILFLPIVYLHLRREMEFIKGCLRESNFP